MNVEISSKKGRVSVHPDVCGKESIFGSLWRLILFTGLHTKQYQICISIVWVEKVSYLGSATGVQ